MWKGKLISAGSNAKTIKGDGSEYLTAILYLAPADLVSEAGISGNVCPAAILAGCKAGCLNTAGRGAFNNVQRARLNKTVAYFSDRAAFMAQLVEDITKFVRYCSKRGIQPCVRLNGTSDIQWERGHPVTRDGAEHADIFAAFPEVQFYDYTKIVKRAYRQLPDNYHLTLSYSEASEEYAESVARAHADGASVAIVYRTKERAREVEHGTTSASLAHGGRYVFAKHVDGDRDDLRFLDPAGAVVALYAKGAAKHDTSGFVVD